MRTFYSRVVVISAAAILPWAVPAPAHAVELPADPVLMHLKDHPELPLAWTGERAELSAEGDTWTFTPVEALQDLGAHLIVHDETGRCLTAGEATAGSDTAPVTLADCADATEWSVVFDDLPDHSDYRFTTADERYLGIAPGTDAAAGTEVLAVTVGSSRHSQEWRLAAPVEPPADESPSPEVTTPEATTPAVSQPTLPQTGAGVAVLGGVGLVAVAAGAVMVLWWRRRTLRDQW